MLLKYIRIYTIYYLMNKTQSSLLLDRKQISVHSSEDLTVLT